MSKKKTLTSSDLIRQVTGQPVYRNYTVESVDEESRTVELAFSSEYPVERWFGYEVLIIPLVRYEWSALRRARLR